MFDAAYYFLKLSFFFGLVRALVKSDELAKHYLFLGVIYTAGVAFISYVFILSTRPFPAGDWLLQVSRAVGLKPWLCWLAATLLISTFYFKLLQRFDEGAVFWILIFLGVPVVLF